MYCNNHNINHKHTVHTYSTTTMAKGQQATKSTMMATARQATMSTTIVTAQRATGCNNGGGNSAPGNNNNDNDNDDVLSFYCKDIGSSVVT